MSVRVVSVDRDALPDELLPLAKQHLRVDWSYDDAFIKSALQRAIAKLEVDDEETINPTTVIWTPAVAEFLTLVTGATTPVRPASAFTATTPGDPDPVDVSADYELVRKWDSIHGIEIQVLEGAAVDGLAVTLTAGFVDVAALPPDRLDDVLSLAAHLYEHREILVPGREFVRPDVSRTRRWMPRV